MSANVADRPLSLAVHLEAAAGRIEGDKRGYCWTSTSACNCGIIAQTIGLTPKGIYDAMIQGQSGTWATLTRRYETCSVTGSPLDKVFSALSGAGIKSCDLGHLEFLRDQSIINRATKIGFSTDCGRDYSTPLNVIAYMRAWATMIREYRAEHDQSCPEPAAKLFAKAS